MQILDEPRPVAGTAQASVPATELAPAATTTAAPSPMTIKQAAVAYIQSREPEVLALVAKYQNLALDLSTPKALTAGRAVRTEVREKGRLAIQRDRDGLKDVLNAAKKDAEAEADRLIAIVKPVEDHLQAQIEAREAVIAAEKAERERLAAEAAAKERTRVEGIKAEIAAITGLFDRARGAESAKIAAAIGALESLVIGESFAEFKAEAEKARTDTLGALRGLHATALDREAEAARVKAQAEENARIAAELAEQKRQLEAQAAALKKQQDEAAAAERAKAEAAEAQARREREAAEAEQRRVAAEQYAAALAQAPVTPPTAAPADDMAPQTSLAESASQAPTVHSVARAAITKASPVPSLETATPAELRNEWALFNEALQRLDPVIRKHGASIDTTRYIRALERIQTLFS